MHNFWRKLELLLSFSIYVSNIESMLLSIGTCTHQIVQDADASEIRTNLRSTYQMSGSEATVGAAAVFVKSQGDTEDAIHPEEEED